MPARPLPQPGAIRRSLRICFLNSALPLWTFLLIDPISDMKRTIFKSDSVRLSVGQEYYDVLIYEGQIPQIEHHLAPRRLDYEQLLKVLNILRLHPAADCEHHMTIC